jgi:hypothetical protein
MAKRKRSRRGFGNIIEVRRGVNGLFDSNTVVGTALPILVGGGTAVGAIWLVRRFVVPKLSPGTQTGAMLNRHAPAIGMAAGALLGASMAYGLKQGHRAAIAATTTALLAGAGAYVREGTLAIAPAATGTAGFGAIVPEYGSASGMGMVMPQMNGLGATVLENWPQGHRPDSIAGMRGLSGDYGTNIQLQGLGDAGLNMKAFGTPGFRV